MALDCIIIDSQMPVATPPPPRTRRPPPPRDGSTYDIDKNIQRFARPLLHQLCRVVLRPLRLFVLAEIPSECLLAPRAIARVRDWRVRGDGSIFAGVLEELVRRKVIRVSYAIAMQGAISHV